MPENCRNFRDVGWAVNWLAGRPLMQEARLVRGGRIDHVENPADIGRPGTIVSVRNSPDIPRFDCSYVHVPGPRHAEKYRAQDRGVRSWLNDVLAIVQDDARPFPVLIHCMSGKDRTGVVIASILKICGIPNAVILDEYLLGDGELYPDLVREFLTVVEHPERYFHRTNCVRVREKLLIDRGAVDRLKCGDARQIAGPILGMSPHRENRVRGRARRVEVCVNDISVVKQP